MKRFASTVAAALITLPMALSSIGASAQNVFPMPGSNPYAWISQLSNGRNQQSMYMVRACMSRPGACKGLAAQQSLNYAVQSLQKKAQERARQRKAIQNNERVNEQSNENQLDWNNGQQNGYGRQESKR